MNIWKLVFFGVLRTLLAGFSGYLVKKGIIEENNVEMLIAGIGTGLITLAASIGNKLRLVERIHAALHLPARSTVEDLDVAIHTRAISKEKLSDV